MTSNLANEKYFYAGHVNGLCKFVHHTNAHEKNRNTYNKFSQRDPDDNAPFTHGVTMPDSLFGNCVVATQFFENDCAFPWLYMMTKPFSAARSAPVTHEKARYYESHFGDLATYEYLRNNGSKCLLSYVPDRNFGYNDLAPDLWVPCNEAVSHSLLPDNGLRDEWLLEY